MVPAQRHSSIEASRLAGQYSWLTKLLRVGWGDIEGFFPWIQYDEWDMILT